MKVRFLADADLNLVIVRALRRKEPSLDFLTASDAGLAGLKDPEVLRRAATLDRVLVTHDRRTMPRHFADLVSQRTSPGVIIVPQKLPISVAVEELLVIWSLTEAEEWMNRICGLPL